MCRVASAHGSSLVFGGTVCHLACAFHTGIRDGSEMPLGLQSSPNDQGPTYRVTSVPRTLRSLGKADDPSGRDLCPWTGGNRAEIQERTGRGLALYLAGPETRMWTRPISRTLSAVATFTCAWQGLPH